MTPPRLLLIDGRGQDCRAFHALPALTAPDGMPTHAVVGFPTVPLRPRREERPDSVAGGPLDDLRRQDPDLPAVRALFGELGFSGLLGRLDALGPTPTGAAGPGPPAR